MSGDVALVWYSCSIGIFLTLCWYSVGAPPMLYLHSADLVLVLCWCCCAYWCCTGTLQYSIGIVLVLCWNCAAAVLALYLQTARAVLVLYLHRTHAAEVLCRFCSCAGRLVLSWDSQAIQPAQGCHRSRVISGEFGVPPCVSSVAHSSPCAVHELGFLPEPPAIL